MNPAIELAGSSDQYKTICISTGHIRSSDAEKLREDGDNPSQNMIMTRDTGFFVKLYSDDHDEVRVLEQDYPGYSEAFYNVMKHVKEAGFTLVEFDCDATVYNSLPTFDW